MQRTDGGCNTLAHTANTSGAPAATFGGCVAARRREVAYVPSREWTFEADATTTAMMLLAHHAQQREAAMAAIIALIRADEIDGVAYALGPAFAELAQPGRDRHQPFVNVGPSGPAALRNDYSITANSLIAAAANSQRSAAELLLQRLPIEEKIKVVSLLLDLVLYGIRRLPPSPATGKPPAR
jgi:hypothetical protein